MAMIARSHIDDLARISVIVVRISTGITVAVAVAIAIWITVSVVAVSKRKPNPDPHGNPGLTLRHCRESKGADRQRNQKKFLPVHNVSSVNVIANLTRI